MVKILIVLAVAAVASGAPHHSETFTSAVNPDERIAAPAAVANEIPRVDNDYQFSYSISDPLTGDDKDQVESRTGPVVQGRYSLIEPDGQSRRVVQYSADDAAGFNAVVHNEPAVQPAVAVAPAVRADAAVPALRAQPVAYPAVKAEPAAVQYQATVAPAVRAEPVAIHQQVVAPAAVQTHHVAYTPTTQISYQPVVRTTAYAPPPAVSSQTISHTSRTVHPQPVIYQNQVENVPVATPALRADHYLQTNVVPAVTHQLTAVAPAIRADIVPVDHTNYISRIALPFVGSTYFQPAYHNQYLYH